MSKKNKDRFGGIRHMAIARKITLLYGGIFSVSLLIISLFMTLNISAIQQHNTRRELTHTISNIEAYLERGGLLKEERLAELLDNKYVEVSVFSFEAECFYNSHVGEAPSFIQTPKSGLRGLSPLQIEMNQETPGARLREKELAKDGFRINVQRQSAGNGMEYILENEQNQQFMLISSYVKTDTGAYRIEAFKLIDVNSSFIRGFIVKLATIDFVGVFCAFLIGRYISRRMLRPVAAIRAAAERITIEDLSRRIETDGPDDEMKELTVTFNSMIDRLEKSFNRQNQFISDASHELRTPISVIQGYANLINRWGKSDPDILQESIDSIVGETDHMSALIRKLLFLAKGDQNRMPTQKEKLSLNEVAGELVRELEVLEVERQIILEEEAQADIWGDGDLIKQLLWVYAENALKYTKNGGEITMRVWKDKKFAYISISDDGTGISEEDLPKIFDRFYRVDKSRNKEISGTGLGLSIAKWIMDSHEGTVMVESKLGEGSTFINAFQLYKEEKKEEKSKILEKQNAV